MWVLTRTHEGDIKGTHEYAFAHVEDSLIHICVRAKTRAEVGEEIKQVRKGVIRNMKWGLYSYYFH